MTEKINSIASRKRSMSQNRIIFLLIALSVIALGGCAFLALTPAQLSSQMRTCYYVLIAAYFFYLIPLMLLFARFGVDILEPIVLVGALYFALMVFGPLICIIIGDTDILGIDTMGGCVKGTIVFLISFYAYCLGYYLPMKNKIKTIDQKLQIVEKLQKGWIIRTMIFVWIICLSVTVLYDVSIGRSKLYMFSFGQLGHAAPQEAETPLKGLIDLSYALLGAWVYLSIYWKHKGWLTVMYFLTLSVFVTRGFRFIVVIALLAPIVLHYLRAEKRPKLINIVLLIAFLIMLMGTIGSIRTALRTGKAIEGMSTGVSAVQSVFNSDFTTYKSYYGIIEAFPSKMNYQFGREIFLGTALMMIPRAIWPGKPEPVTHQIEAVAVSTHASLSGEAYPNLGEFYFEFGIIGCIIFMFIFGRLCCYLKQFMKAQSITGKLIFSISFFALIQLIGRGYIPSNFYLVLFLNLPMILMCIRTKVKQN